MHEIVMIGASAGFACAFGAPIGGALFVYEEVASHWTQHQQMTSRVMFGVGIAVAFLNILNTPTVYPRLGCSLYHSRLLFMTKEITKSTCHGTIQTQYTSSLWLCTLVSHVVLCPVQQ